MQNYNTILNLFNFGLRNSDFGFRSHFLFFLAVLIDETIMEIISLFSCIKELSNVFGKFLCSTFHFVAIHLYLLFVRFVLFKSEIRIPQSEITFYSFI